MTSTVTEPTDALPDEDGFRSRAREFLQGHAPERAARDESEGYVPERVRPEAEVLSAAHSYQSALFDAGLAALTWPREYGGQGLTGRYQTIFNEEAATYDTPDAVYTIGFGMCIPTVMAHGTEEHKQRYVRPAARGEEIWCQLFSEPSNGSDVAGLRSAAIQDGDEWILNGQKVWTSGAQWSQYGIVLCRTDPEQPKHRGLSMFILDMSSPGVTVRPLRQMNGGSGFNEVFFDNVRIPGDRILGRPGDGWRVALTTLMNERVAIGTGRSAEKASPLTPIAVHRDLARSHGLIDDPIVRQDLTDLLIRYWILDMVGMRIRATLAAGREPGPEGSIAKLSGALLSKRAADVACRLAGPAAAAWTEGDGKAQVPSQLVLSAPGGGIAGGTNEVMRNILGERVLGLPKDPQVDKDMPFREIPRGV